MISSRTRTGLYETLPKTPDSAPKVPKGSRPSSKPEHDPSTSPLQSGKQSGDRSPRLADSRLRPFEPKVLERRSLKMTTPEKRVGKGTELQAVQEDLKKTKELLEKSEAERLQAIDELNEAKRLADEANEELPKAVALQKEAEENSAIEKLRADELEQANIMAIQKIEQKLQSDIDLVKKQHAADASALLSAIQDRDRIKQELHMVKEAKNATLQHAEDAMRIAEDNAKKVDFLSAELAQMRKALDEARASHLAACEEKASSDSMWDCKLKQSSRLVEKLDSEVKILKQDLEKAKMVEAKLVEAEGVIYLVKKQQAADASALLSTVQERDRIKQELDMVTEAKNTVVQQAENAMKIADDNAKEVEDLSGKLAQMRKELDEARASHLAMCEEKVSSDSMWDFKLKKSSKLVEQLDSEVKALKQELVKAREIEAKLVEAEGTINLVKKQHAADASALLSAVQERDMIKQELEMVTEAKDNVLQQAQNAMNIADDNAKKVEAFSGELAQMRKALDEARASHLAMCEEKVSSDSMWDFKLKESFKLVEKLDSEVKTLTKELEKERVVEAKFVEAEGMIERLQGELTDAKNNESTAVSLTVQLKEKVEFLEVEIGKLKSVEKTTNETVVSLLKQLEESNEFLEEAKAEIASLKGSINSLDESLGKHRSDLERSGRQMESAKLEADSMSKTIKSLKAELERMEEAQAQAQAHENEEKLSLKIERLTEEKKILSDDLETIKEEEQKNKITMDDLASSLFDVSVEAKKGKEDLTTTQCQLAETRSKMELLQLSLQAAEEKLKFMTAKLKEENDYYKIITEKNDFLLQSLKSDWDEKEASFLTCIKTSEEEIKALKRDLARIGNSLKDAEAESTKARENGEQLKSSLIQLKSELSSTKQVAEHATSQGIALRETLDAKENELSRISRENKELNDRDAAAQEKIDDLLNLLAGRALQHAEAEEGGAQLQISLNQFKAELSSAKRAAEHATSESLKWKEILDVKGTELATINQANRELRTREAAALEKINELSNQLEDETSQKAKEYGAQLQASLNKLTSELSDAKQNAEHATSENLWLKENLGIRENELARIRQEGTELHAREAAALEKVEALSKLLSEKRKVEEDSAQLHISLNQVKSELSSAKEVADHAISESLRFREIVDEKENEMAKLYQENKELCAREAASLAKIDELSKLLVEKGLQKADKDDTEDIGALEVRRKVESSYGTLDDKIQEKSTSFLSSGSLVKPYDPVELKLHDDDGKDEDESVEIEATPWDSDNLRPKDGLSSESLDAGLVQKQQKKKKALLQKFGGLLKKKHSHIGFTKA